MIQPTAGPLPRRRPRHHCRRLVGQVEDSGHGMGHAARGPNIAEFRAAEVREPLIQTGQALVEFEGRRETLLVVELGSLQKSLLVVELAMLKQEMCVELETTDA